LPIHDIDTLEAANDFLRRQYIAEFNRRFSVAAEAEGTAFVPCLRQDLDRIFAIQTESVVGKDNTVKFKNLLLKNLLLQIERQAWRGSPAGCRVTVYQHFDETISLGFGAHTLGSYAADGLPLKPLIKTRKTSLMKSFSENQTGHLMC